MNRLRLVTRSLAHHWRTGTMVVFGLATATAVVTGALVTGDSVHGSLRDTGLARLGRITHAMVAPAYFRAALAEDLQAVGEVSAAVLTQGAARNLDTDAVTPGVTVLGVDPGFWQLHDAGLELSGRECAINEALAGDLGVAVGDALLLTIHRQRAIASDTLFARRERQDIAPSMRLTVKQVLPAGGTGDFRLDTQSSAPRNVFISRDWLDSSLQLNGKANVLVASGEAEVLAAALEQACTLEDHGLRLTPNDTRGDLDLTSDAMLLTEQQVSAARAAAADAGTRAARTSVYLATDIATRGPSTRAISYAVVAGLESLRESDPIPTPGTAWVNVWAASDLACAPGDALDISYMVPTDDGTYPIDEMTAPVERVVELAGPTADRSLVPNFEGMTDAVNMSDWDPPFPIDLDRVTDRDEEYWDLYRATPKVFVGLDDVREMWQSAPGRDDADWVTSMRVGIVWPTEGDGFGPYFSLKLLQRLTLEASGLVFAPVRELTVEASEGTSDFGQLLLSLSMFLVMSGAGLAAMLLRLSVDRRASETGIMLACGCNTKLVGRVLFAEGALLSGLGAVVGVPAGLLYAYAMVAALGSWWQGALGSMPTLWLHVSAGNLVAGGVPGLVVGLLAAWWSVRRLRKRRVLELLGGWQAMVVAPERKRPWAAILTLVLSLGLLGLRIVRNDGVRNADWPRRRAFARRRNGRMPCPRRARSLGLDGRCSSPD